jgi:hypothetical protein
VKLTPDLFLKALAVAAGWDETVDEEELATQ